MATTLAHKSSAGDGSEVTHTVHNTTKKRSMREKIPVNNKFLDINNNNNNKREVAAAAAKSAEL